MQFLFLGDVVGEMGIQLVEQYLPELKKEFKPQVTIVNGENTTKSGRGITQKLFKDLMKAGAGVVTLGNHAWNNQEIFTFINQTPNLLRPLNYPGTKVPGHGYATLNINGTQVAVINLQGRVFMETTDDPFAAIDRLVNQLHAKGIKVIFVDFHAETTSEKKAMALFLDGRVSAVVGTHTHVQTNDPQILTNGTAFLTDAGMTGPATGVIGMEYQPVIQKFLTARPNRFAVQTTGPGILSGCVVNINPQTGHAKKVQTILIDHDHPYHNV
ncbi:TIGR00282 family metallophosphoesterase [Fructilactobacillus cliffordii]|uniref:TIGR00282 family metallophosphoesterase n=1 Tax=Fructilactobacillus cliffordii TaxID=2940299 RepID=A0A9Q9E3D7_9LACO|nr:TIGR00282 family metallophosphoesterase [Fructilactobacillus cliffordii]USS86813.1 TIGR00282 family metallophosphoesterase [Fructilactobacillus cliffordii]USS89809.1 TIGR00282 family metallophosphoesterase [Fructilactobacillus cliffordii]